MNRWTGAALAVVALAVVFSNACASASDEAAATTTISVSPTSPGVVSATSTTVAAKRSITGTLLLSGGRGSGVGRQSNAVGSRCGMLSESNPLAVSDSAVVTVTDRAGKIVGSGTITGSSLLSAEQSATGFHQVCELSLDVTIYETPDLASVRFEFDGVTAPIDTRVDGSLLADGVSLPIELSGS